MLQLEKAVCIFLKICHPHKNQNLFFFLFCLISLLGILPLDSTSTATSEGRLQGEVDVLLRT
jgi:predicted membrane channel-forming protein YqfA (hemolysin III family)